MAEINLCNEHLASKNTRNLADTIQRFANIIGFSLTRCTVDEGADLVALMAAFRGSRVRTIRLVNCRLTSESFKGLELGVHPRVLDLSHNHIQGISWMNGLTMAIQRSKLEELNLYRNRVLASSLESVLSSLKRVNLAGNHLTDEDAVVLARAMGSLESVNVEENALTERGIHELCRSVSSSTRELRLGFNTHARVKDIQPICGALTQRLRVLGLDMLDIDDTQCVTLGQAVSGALFLEELSLRDNYRMTNTTAFIESMGNPRSLRDISLQGTGMWDVRRVRRWLEAQHTVYAEWMLTLASARVVDRIGVRSVWRHAPPELVRLVGSFLT